MEYLEPDHVSVFSKSSCWAVLLKKISLKVITIKGSFHDQSCRGFALMLREFIERNKYADLLEVISLPVPQM